MEHTQIVVVLDRSGSMQECREATIRGFNEFLESQKVGPGTARLYLAQFDDEYQFLYDRPIAEAVALNGENYIPRGWTALLDAIGRTINEMGAILSAIPPAERPSKILFAIVTDGLENRSTEFSREKIREMVTHQQDKYGWEFIFLGANQDAVIEGEKLGVPLTHAATFGTAAPQARAAFVGLSRSTLQARAGKSAMIDPSARAAMAPRKP